MESVVVVVLHPRFQLGLFLTKRAPKQLPIADEMSWTKASLVSMSNRAVSSKRRTTAVTWPLIRNGTARDRVNVVYRGRLAGVNCSRMRLFVISSDSGCRDLMTRSSTESALVVNMTTWPWASWENWRYVPPVMTRSIQNWNKPRRMLSSACFQPYKLITSRIKGSMVSRVWNAASTVRSTQRAQAETSGI